MRDEFATYIEQFGCEVFLDHEEGEELAAYAKRLPSAGDLLARVVASPDAPQCFSEIADWGPTAGTPPCLRRRQSTIRRTVPNRTVRMTNTTSMDRQKSRSSLMAWDRFSGGSSINSPSREHDHLSGGLNGQPIHNCEAPTAVITSC